jgi:hypothetical protein
MEEALAEVDALESREEVCFFVPKERYAFH